MKTLIKINRVENPISLIHATPDRDSNFIRADIVLNVLVEIDHEAKSDSEISEIITKEIERIINVAG